MGAEHGGVRAVLGRQRRRLVRALRAPIERQIGVITHVATQEAVAALTFDDGPNPDSTPHLLEVLKRRGARATFFMVGEMARRYPQLVDDVARAGHAIGNHSWNHPSFPVVSAAERRRQIERCETQIAAHSHGLFRPPFGDLDWPARLQLFMRGYRVIGWNVSASDWEQRDATLIASEVQRQLKPGSIVLMHDQLFAYSDSDRCARDDMLGAVDKLVERDDFRFVTVPELLTMGTPQGRFWTKRSETDWLHGLQSVADLGFKY